MSVRPSDRIQRVNPNEAYFSQGANDWAAFGVSPEATGTLALVAGTAVVTPVFVPSAITIKRIGAVVTVAAAAAEVARLGLYEWDPATKKLGALVKDYGTVLVDATSLRNTANAADVVKPGWYAWVIVSDGAPTVRTVLGSQGEQAEAFTVSTTNLVATAHYTAAAGFVAGTAMPASGADVVLTRVTSTSEFRPTNIVLGQYTPSKIAV